jgi:hypothetical protein
VDAKAPGGIAVENPWIAARARPAIRREEQVDHFTVTRS